MADLLSPKQLEFITDSTAKLNFAHGSVRSGKTVGTLFRFMNACYTCPDSSIWMIGKTSESIFDNAIRLILEPKPPHMGDPLAVFRPFCRWNKGARELKFMDKTIGTLGAKDSGAVGIIQGKTFSLAYCDEMTLYPENVTEMIRSRLSNEYSMLFSSMNPSHPNHIIKKWIDLAEKGDPLYYSLHFTVEDNPYLDEDYIRMLRESSSGLFYKRNYLGLWCLAEGAIFDFFDRSVHVVRKPPRAAEYWIAGIDFGTSNAFACVLIGVSTGRYDQTGVMMWVEKEYFFDSRKAGYQKTNFEYAQEVKEFLEPYGVKSLYVDPSSASFKVELRRMGMHPIDANNEVTDGIHFMASQLKSGRLFICHECTNLTREMESYVWDERASEKGDDEPLKKDDHCIDAVRYAVYTHKPTSYNQQEDLKRAQEWRNNKYQVTRNF